jgi:hypothetical protein
MRWSKFFLKFAMLVFQSTRFCLSIACRCVTVEGIKNFPTRSGFFDITDPYVE